MPNKDIIKRREYNKIYHRLHKDKDRAYYIKNRKKILAKKKKYAIKYGYKIKVYRNKIKLKYPWRSSFLNAKNRCNNKNGQNYNTYGQRGIKFLLTFKEVEIMWNRDKAFSMSRPSLDRINNDGNYEFSNCRFIEMSENATKGNYETRWKK